MPSFASFLLITAVIASIVPPGYPAYVGAYVTMSAALLAFLAYGWRERAAFGHPSALAIIAGIALIAATVPFVYRSSDDLLGPVLMLPLLCVIAMGVLARPARWVPDPTTFACICLAGALLAFLGGSYEHFVLGVARPGLGNNPIHYGSLAAMAGGLAMVGVAFGKSPWRFAFLLGPFLGLGAAVVSNSRGPTASSLVMIGVGFVLLAVWLRRDRLFRLAVLASMAISAIPVYYLISTDNTRIAGLAESALDIFRFTGGSDDIRAALYASALQVLRDSPFVGIGLGQLMQTAEAMFPDLVPSYRLENLHADWANFAAMSGSLGLLAYLLFVTAPLLLLLETKARQDRTIVLGAAVLVSGQLTLGVSNATFGILPQSILYAVGLGYFLVRARRLALGLEPEADR